MSQLIDPGTGKTVGVVAIAATHGGGITTSMGWAFVRGSTNGIIFNTSYGRTNRSNLYVVRRGQPDLDKAKLSCFPAQSMSEGITEYGGKVYLVFESGSHLYRSDPKTLNVITRLHKASVSSLTSLA